MCLRLLPLALLTLLPFPVAASAQGPPEVKEAVLRELQAAQAALASAAAGRVFADGFEGGG